MKIDEAKLKEAFAKALNYGKNNKKQEYERFYRQTELWDRNRFVKELQALINDNHRKEMSIKDRERQVLERTTQIINLQTRIDKAIEYIEQEDWNTEYDKKLLDILKGSDKE